MTPWDHESDKGGHINRGKKTSRRAEKGGQPDVVCTEHNLSQKQRRCNNNYVRVKPHQMKHKYIHTEMEIK